MKRTIPLLVSLALVGCATLKTGGKVAPHFQGATVLDMRQKEIQAKAMEALKGKCPQPIGTQDPGGLIELKADAEGKITARTMIWKGSDEFAKCLTTELSKGTLSPLSGPAITTLTGFGAYKPGEQPNDRNVQKQLFEHEGRLKETATATCGNLLPPEFPADIKIAFYIFPGGKVGGLNITESNAKDGPFEVCVAKLISESKFPDTGFDGAYAAEYSQHFGRIENR